MVIIEDAVAEKTASKEACVYNRHSSSLYKPCCLMLSLSNKVIKIEN